MGMIPAKMTGRMPFMTTSGFMTPSDEMPSDDLAMPYAEPRFVRHMASAMPNEPKNGVYTGQYTVGVTLLSKSCINIDRKYIFCWCWWFCLFFASFLRLTWAVNQSISQSLVFRLCFFTNHIARP